MAFDSQRPMSDARTRAFVDSLLGAQTEAEVHDCLEQAGMLDDSLWRAYGGVQNNSGTFLNQQADARGALVEKIVNSIDAVLTREAHARGDMGTGDLPRSMFDAAERYFGIRDGKLHNISPAERNQLAARSVQVVFSGERRRPTVTIVDQGEGQSPQRFPETFVSLSADNKRTIPFVQGKFNMGSAGAVPFCGTEHHYQLILSRRHQDAPGDSRRWGVTVVRRRRPDRDEKTSVFQYLAPGGEILSCTAETMPLWHRGAGHVDLAAGSLIRLYEYDIPERGQAWLDFSRMLNRRLYRLPVPVQVIERRYESQGGPITVSGMETQLVDASEGIVATGWPQGGEIAVPGLGRVRLTITPFEPASAGTWLRASESVIFTINGQAHAFESRHFLRGAGSTRPNLAWLASTLLVEVDCSGFEPRVVEQLFMGSRDRMRDNEQRHALLDAIGEYLRGHGGLRALNDRRRQEAVRQQGRDDPRTEELFGRLSSDISRFLRGGAGRAGQGGDDEAGFQGKRFPTYLSWAGRGVGDELEKHCPANGGCTVELNTDAENGFLTRPDAPGICVVEPEDWFLSHALTDGELRIRLKAPGEAPTVGERIPLVVRLLSDDALVSEHVAEGCLVVDPPAPKPDGGGGSESHPARRKRRGAGGPRIVPVYRDDDVWRGLGFGESTLAKIDNAGERTTAYVNMDNASLTRYRRGQPRRAEEINRVYSLAAAAMGLAADTAVSSGELEIDPEAVEHVLGVVARVLAPTLDFVNQNAFAMPDE